jgi:hypothetical protein
MGWELAEEVQRHAPASLTYRELYVLTVLAQDARTSTRTLLGGIENRPDIIKRLRTGKRERAAVIASLIRKGALVRVQQGRRGTHAVFRIPPFTKGAATAHPNDGNRVREQRHEGAGTAAIECGNTDVRVRVSRTPSRHPVSPGDIPSGARSPRPGAAADPIEIIKEEIERATGRQITSGEAESIRKFIIGGRPVKHQALYCRRTIQAEPNPAQRFLPHSQPLPPPQPNGNPADPEHVAAVTDSLRQQLRQRQPAPAPATPTAPEQET